jgi:two-component system chemotaxis sensor kinase CheA
MGADDALVTRLRSLFAEELREGLQVLVDGLLVLEREAETPDGSRLVRELFRAAHSLKGAAHAASVPEAVDVCDRLESALAAVRDHELVPDTAVVTTLLSYTDVLIALAARLDPDGEAPAPAPLPEAPPVPAPAAEPAAAASLRVDADKVDLVLREAGAATSASLAVHDLAGQAAAVAEQLAAATTSARCAGPAAASPALTALLDDAARAATALARAAEVTDRALHHASTGVTTAVQQLRTQPFAQACTSLERVVRDIAADSGRPARFRLTGGDVDVDRAVVSALRDPLLHLVRNAVDHGVEDPDVRAAAGKPRLATVEVSASVVGSLLNVVVRDDGAGIDTEALRQAAAARGLAVPDQDEELVFVPGLTSRPSVTAVSGRGVGMDAARATLEQLGGSLRVVSRPGAGTEVHLTSPVTLAVMRVLLVRAGAQVVALPTSAVERVADVPRQELRSVEGEALLTLHGRTRRAVSLASVMRATSGTATDTAACLSVVVPREGDCVLITDGLLDEVEVAVQPVPARLAGAPGVLGMSVGRGQLPLLVMNPVAVGRAAAGFRLPARAAAPSAAARILLAEDTVTTRALERSILESAGYAVSVAVDGADAWEQLQADGTDLVVSDVDMPRMSGIELCRRIRGSAQLRETPVVLVTSLDSAADRQRGLEAGADAYVVKAELQQGSLLDAIARLL